jgi:hypothetical protein
VGRSSAPLRLVERRLPDPEKRRSVEGSAAEQADGGPDLVVAAREGDASIGVLWLRTMARRSRTMDSLRPGGLLLPAPGSGVVDAAGGPGASDAGPSYPSRPVGHRGPPTSVTAWPQAVVQARCRCPSPAAGAVQDSYGRLLADSGDQVVDDGRAVAQADLSPRAVPPPFVQPGLRAITTSVSPGQSQKIPSAERFASSARTSVAKSSRRSPNRCGAENEVDK